MLPRVGAADRRPGVAWLMGEIRAVVPPRDAGQQPSRDGRYPLMDGARALAAFLIFLFHAGRRAEPTGAGDVVNALSIGVPIFFLISGFLLYRPFAVTHLRGEPGPAAGAYAWRRFLRIVPVFWLALTVVLLVQPEPLDAGGIARLFLFAQVYDPVTLDTGISQAWSLNCEVVYYAMLPLVALVTRALAARGDRAARLRWEVVALVVLACWSVAYKVWFHRFGELTSPRDEVFLFHPGWNLDLFVAGMAIALWSARDEVRGRSGRLALWLRGAAAWLAAGAVVAFAGTVVLQDRYREPLGNAALHYLRLVCGACVLLLVVHAADRSPRTRRVFGNRWVLALGGVSYAFYLFHQAILGAVYELDVGGDRADGLRNLAALAISVVASVLSWVLVERPVLRLKRLVPDRRRGTASLATAEQPVPGPVR